MHFKQYVSALLAACLMGAAAAALPAAAETESDKTSADGAFGYVLLEDGGVAVNSKDTNAKQVQIPELIDGYQVTALADGCFANHQQLTQVTLPDGLTVIGDEAFASCEKLAGIELPESIMSIGASAFSGCSALTEVTIPAGVTEIGDYAFDTTESMTAFTVADANSNYTDHEGVLFDKAMTTLIKYPESRPDTSYTVPDTCKTVAGWAFIGSQHLETVDLGQVTAIGEDAFYYCVKLEHIAIPEGVTELVGATFCYCVELEQITLPSTLEAIGENCFYSCTALTDVVLPEGLKKISAYAFFHCTSLQSLNVPASVETLVTNCMGYCYDEEVQTTGLQEDFTLYVQKGTPGYTYASSNEIAYKTTSGDTLYYVLIGAAAVVMVGLAAAIVVVIRKRKAQ